MKLLPAILILCLVHNTLSLGNFEYKPPRKLYQKCPENSLYEYHLLSHYISRLPRLKRPSLRSTNHYNLIILEECVKRANSVDPNFFGSCPSNPQARINDLNYQRLIGRLNKEALMSIDHELKFLQDVCIAHAAKSIWSI